MFKNICEVLKETNQRYYSKCLNNKLSETSFRFRGYYGRSKYNYKQNNNNNNNKNRNKYNNNNSFKQKPYTFLPYITLFYGTNAAIDSVVSTDEGNVVIEDENGNRTVSHFLEVFKPEKPGIPKSVLVLDGGGLRGCMSIQILKALEAELKKIDKDIELWQVFDLVVGTSTGGLIAIALCKQKMNCEEIDTFYNEVADKVFKGATSVLKKFSFAKAAVFPTSGALDSNELAKVLKNVVKERGMYEKDEIDQTKVSVIATMTNNINLPLGLMLRSYDIKGEVLKHSPNAIDPNLVENCGYIELSSKYNYLMSGINHCKIWEAARATSAAPTYFDELVLNMPRELAERWMLRNLLESININLQDVGPQTNTDIPQNVTDTLNNIVEKIYHLKYVKHKDYTEPSRFNFWSSDPRAKDMEEMVNIINKEIVPAAKARWPEFDIKKCTLDKFKELVFDFKYELHLQDGGMNSNSPLLFGYVEASRMWPESDINMISIGTGRAYLQDYPKLNRSGITFANLFGYIFDAKELTSLSQMYSYAARKDAGFNLQRMNPGIDASKSEMSDIALMDYWRKKGKDFAKDHESSIKLWAEYLHDNYKKNKNKA